MRRCFFVAVSVLVCGKLLGDLPTVPLPQAEMTPSLRLECLGSELAGIVSDSLTDLLWNPARLPGRNGIAGKFPNRLVFVVPGPLKLRLGVIAEIRTCEQELSDEYANHSSDWDDYYSYVKTEHQDQWKGKLFASKSFSPRSVLGLRYGYDNSPSGSTEEYVWSYLNNTSSSYDQYRRRDIRIKSSNDKSSTLTHAVTLGYLRKMGKNSSMELLGDFQVTCESVNSVSEETDADSLLYGDKYGPTSGYVREIIAVSADYENGESIATPLSLGIGGKYSRKLSNVATFHIAGMTYTGKGTAKSVTVDSTSRFTRSYRFNYSDSDTTWTYDDTSSFSRSVRDSLGGDAIVVTGFLKTGAEINIASDFVAGFGVCISYEYLDLPMSGISREGESIAESLCSKTIYIKVPFGMEYTLGKGISFRLGLLATEIYESSISEEGDERKESSALCGPLFTKTAGFGWQLFRNLNLDIAATPIMDVYSWRIQVLYRL